ncbi:hypothetical protein BAUCODRAFT_151411 [Baudoinia panamericana UAMH 10762]|uniref:Uncharacterized protein n=1 Tax=Baudoinia panamericana (strain UAMH 10762) TaxID=717646 RepID=M2N239_BAUPA|nr:uncharacterized protein BAUCODRAFT_151411 [Baudoinia panamericana UAMH 10762]EMC93039.1 hypothetical protein BAUCODRAFT_151411 [Baudoinia panamericana UAMH 10762]
MFLSITPASIASPSSSRMMLYNTTSIITTAPSTITTMASPVVPDRITVSASTSSYEKTRIGTSFFLWGLSFPTQPTSSGAHTVTRSAKLDSSNPGLATLTTVLAMITGKYMSIPLLLLLSTGLAQADYPPNQRRGAYADDTASIAHATPISVITLAKVLTSTVSNAVVTSALCFNGNAVVLCGAPSVVVQSTVSVNQSASTSATVVVISTSLETPSTQTTTSLAQSATSSAMVMVDSTTSMNATHSQAAASPTQPPARSATSGASATVKASGLRAIVWSAALVILFFGGQILADPHLCSSGTSLMVP